MAFRFVPGSCCCVEPIIAISTIDSSVNYAHLCNFEDASGCFPPFVAPCGPVDCPERFPTDPPGDCVGAPKAVDIAKYNADQQLMTDALDKHGKEYPLAGGEILGGFKCWAGTKNAVVPAGQSDPEDSFGPMEFVLTGTSATARITLQDLKNLFETLYDKHFPPPGGVRNKSHEAVFLFDVDNTGSILLSEWPASVRTDFLAWLAANYQKVTVRETIITNYLVDGEDWLRRMRDNYIDYIES